MLQVGFGLTVTVRVHWLGQPSRVTLSVRVKVPAPLAVTLTEAPVVDPLIVPFPLIDQLCVTVPPVGSTVELYVWVVASQTGLSPVKLQVGFGLTVTVRVHWLGQLSRVTLSVSVKEPAAVLVTLTEASVVEPLIVPLPLMDQLWVTVPPAGSTVEV